MSGRALLTHLPRVENLLTGKLAFSRACGGGGMGDSSPGGVHGATRRAGGGVRSRRGPGLECCLPASYMAGCRGNWVRLFSRHIADWITAPRD